ncbi:MAG: three-Cys-motif partner protein TcmP [Candidatus Azambacteria bacterium]|nr:three-Cys-motif partner protein TcmP [Candidatus Azambacteria bacterium]
MDNNKDFWNITNKPQTKTKLKILEDYLHAWAKILAKQSWCHEMYFVDCFAGRGKYHNEGKEDSVLGSPLIALEVAKLVKEKYNKDIKRWLQNSFAKFFKIIFDKHQMAESLIG